jgi:choline-sulfatase
MPRYVLDLERAALWGSMVAVFASVPAAARVASAVPSVWSAWLALTAILVAPSACAVLVARLAREAWADLSSGDRRPVLVGIAIWAALCFPADVVLASTLKATTHHRGLGGATFAVLALVIALGAALVAMRIVIVTISILEKRPRGGIALASAALVLLVLALSTPMGRSMTSVEWWSTLPEGVRATIVDASVWLAVVAAAAWVNRPARGTRAGLLGAATALLGIAISGFLVARSSSAISAAIRDRAALAGPLGQLFGFV